MSMLRYLAAISTMMTLPVFCFAQMPPSPVPAFNPGYQNAQVPMLNANYGPSAPSAYAGPMGPAPASPYSAGPVAPYPTGPVAPYPTAPAVPYPTGPMQPMAAPAFAAPSSGVSGSFSDFGAMGAPAGSFDSGFSAAGSGSYFDGGGCSSGDCGLSTGGGSSIGGGVGGGAGGGRYMSLFGGVSDIDDQQSLGFERDVNIDFDEGYALGAAFGKRVGRFFRSEVEYVYRSQDPAIASFGAGGGTLPIFDGNPSGNQDVHAGMFNLFFDLIIGNGNLVPYIGAGVGVGFIDSSIDLNTGQLDGDDTTLAYQWIAGFSYRARPNLEMFVEYRFFELEDPKLNFFGGNPINFRTPNILTNSEYQSQDIFTGFRFNF